jgi:hypothetical protein
LFLLLVEVSVATIGRSTVLSFLLLIGCMVCAFASTTGTITIGGAEQVSSGGIWDSGTVTITVVTANGPYAKTVSYGHFSTPASIASAIAAAFSQDCNSPSNAHAVGALITFQMRAFAITLNSLQLTSTHNSVFPGPSFGSGTTSVSASGQPVITSLLMTKSDVGTPITLSGFNFGPSGTVTFNGVPGTPTSWTSTKIIVPIPAGATSGLVIVTTFGMTSNGVPITLNSAVSCPVP